MRRILQTLLIPVLALMLSACGKKQDPVPVHEGPAEIAFKGIETVHDFGSFERSKDRSHTFRFYNTGSEPLIVHEVSTGCSCMSAEWTKTPVAPGGSGTIKVTMLGNHLSIGTFDRSFTVHSNSKNGDFPLRVKGEVIRSAMKTQRR
jgi:hypothetical protein